MTPNPVPGDLIVLVADADTGAMIEGVLERPKSLGTRSIRHVVRRHPQRDAGCRQEGAAFLRAFVGRYKYAILVFDHEGCGAEHVEPADLESQIERNLSASGWGNNATTIVVAPESDIWIWSESPHVAKALRWSGRSPSLREWLRFEGRLTQDAAKPARSKEAMLAALALAGRKPSPAIYREIADTVSLERCTDRAFVKLKTTLRTWFPEGHL